MDIQYERLILHKAGKRKINDFSEDLWFDTLYWTEGGKFKAVNIYVSTHNRALSPQDKTGDSFEEDLRCTSNAIDQLMKIWEVIKDQFNNIKFYDNSRVTLLTLETHYIKDFKGQSVQDSLRIHVQSEAHETRIYSTLIESSYYIESSNLKRRVQVQHLRLKKHL